MANMTMTKAKNNGRATAPIVNLDPSKKALVLDMPLNAPPLGYDPTADGFSWQEIFPDNYWSNESLKERIAELDGNLPVYTAAYISVQPVFDPKTPEKDRDMKGKPVLYFEENVPGVVLNKSRCRLIADMLGVRDPNYWPYLLGKVALDVALLNGKEQIILARVENDDSDITF